MSQNHSKMKKYSFSSAGCVKNINVLKCHEPRVKIKNTFVIQGIWHHYTKPNTVIVPICHGAKVKYKKYILISNKKF